MNAHSKPATITPFHAIRDAEAELLRGDIERLDEQLTSTRGRLGEERQRLAQFRAAVDHQERRVALLEETNGGLLRMLEARRRMLLDLELQGERDA